MKLHPWLNIVIIINLLLPSLFGLAEPVQAKSPKNLDELTSPSQLERGSLAAQGQVFG
jgi:hypothetical protein